MDGRLAEAGCSLWAAIRSDGTHLRLRLPDEAHERHERAPGVPAFAADLPPRWRERLAPPLAQRRLLVLLEAELLERGLDLLDDERKTVATLRLIEGTARRAAFALRADGGAREVALPPLLVAGAVRGYGAELPPILSVLASRPGLRAVQRGPREQLAELMQAALPELPSLSAIALLPELPAAVALRRVHAVLLAMIRTHEAGVRADLDTEFLHDFRVAVRRTRCLLGQLRRVFPAAELEHWRVELSWLGRLTGRLRDLDVFLLLLADPEVAGEDAPALAPLVEHLQQLQRDEHVQLVTALDSTRYADLLAGWAAFLEQPPGAGDDPPPERAGQPIARVAGRRVERLYRRLRRRGRALEADAPGAEFHAARILAKKLRYVLDCTRGALDPADTGPLLAALKRLQAVLGDVQDASVQRDLLRTLALDLAAGPGAPPATLLAVGRLEERLAARGRRARKIFADRMAQFAGDDLRDHARRLRGDGDAGDDP